MEKKREDIVKEGLDKKVYQHLKYLDDNGIIKENINVQTQKLAQIFEPENNETIEDETVKIISQNEIEMQYDIDDKELVKKYNDYIAREQLKKELEKSILDGENIEEEELSSNSDTIELKESIAQDMITKEENLDENKNVDEDNADEDEVENFNEIEELDIEESKFEDEKLIPNSVQNENMDIENSELNEDEEFEHNKTVDSMEIKEFLDDIREEGLDEVEKEGTKSRKFWISLIILIVLFDILVSYLYLTGSIK